MNSSNAKIIICAGQRPTLGWRHPVYETEVFCAGEAKGDFVLPLAAVIRRACFECI